MIFSYHLKEINNASNFILKNVKSKTVLFDGDLGSGKTTLIKNISTVSYTHLTLPTKDSV